MKTSVSIHPPVDFDRVQIWKLEAVTVTAVTDRFQWAAPEVPLPGAGVPAAS